jgi:Domain of unknown function (DUF4337)
MADTSHLRLPAPPYAAILSANPEFKEPTMGHGPAETIEHAQHDAHHAHDGFDKLVAISVAILAAGLAYVTALSHSTHNAVLQNQLDATLSKNEASNRWTQYQATNIRFHAYQADIAKSITEPVPNTPERAELVESWKKKVSDYESKDGSTGKLPEIKKLAEAAEKLTIDKMQASIHNHHKAAQIDLGELGLQFGVVLASLAILTKRRSFWFAGLACGLAGFLWAMAGAHEFYLHGGAAHDAHSAAEHKSDEHGEKKGH